MIEKLVKKYRAREERIDRLREVNAVGPEFGYEEVQERLEREIAKQDELLATPCKVYLQTFLQELASLWQVDNARLQVGFDFGEFNGRKELSHLVERVVDEGVIRLRCHIVCRRGEEGKLASFDVCVLPQTLFEEQRDGREFLQHLKPYYYQEKIKGESVDKTTFVCDNYNEIILRFPFGKIIYILQDKNFKDVTNTALLRAILRDEKEDRKIKNQEKERE